MCGGEKLGEGATRKQRRERKVKEVVYGYTVVSEDMQVVGMTEEDVEDRKRWKHCVTIHCVDL